MISTEEMESSRLAHEGLHLRAERVRAIGRDLAGHLGATGPLLREYDALVAEIETMNTRLRRLGRDELIVRNPIVDALRPGGGSSLRDIVGAVQIELRSGETAAAVRALARAFGE